MKRLNSRMIKSFLPFSKYLLKSTSKAIIAERRNIFQKAALNEKSYLRSSTWLAKITRYLMHKPIIACNYIASENAIWIIVNKLLGEFYRFLWPRVQRMLCAKYQALYTRLFRNVQWAWRVRAITRAFRNKTYNSFHEKGTKYKKRYRQGEHKSYINWWVIKKKRFVLG